MQKSKTQTRSRGKVETDGLSEGHEPPRFHTAVQSGTNLQNAPQSLVPVDVECRARRYKQIWWTDFQCFTAANQVEFTS